jgi:tetratricopeptide (TPR) repeat protein
VCLLAAVSTVTALDPVDFPDAFQEPFDRWMNGELATESLLQEMIRLYDVLADQPQSWENLYWQTRTAYVRGRIHYERGEKELSIAELERSERLAEASIRLRDNSDSWRMLAEATSLMMAQRGFGFTILNFTKGQDRARRALELDPGNARALHIVALFLCNAPALAGGNTEEGLEILQTQARRTDLTDEDRFMILLTLGEILHREGRTDDALAVCRQALEIFPGNRRGQDFLQTLEASAGA